MNVRKGRTPFAPISFRQGTDERGQIASTIWVEESGGGIIERRTYQGLALYLTDEAVDKVDLAIALSY